MKTAYLSAPSPLQTTPTATAHGVASVALQFVAPIADGGLPILGYVVTRQDNWLGEYTNDVVVSGVMQPGQSDGGRGPETVVVTVVGLVPATAYR